MDNRYSRQTLFKPIAEEGQHKLKHSKVAIIGCGALGSAIAETLVRAGVGTIHLIDRDYVEFSNLQRQQLFTEQDAKAMLPKVVAAKNRLQLINSQITLHTYIQHADPVFMESIAPQVDLIMDATDNFETRLLINDVAFKYNIPWIYGACVGSSGIVFPFIPKKTACFRCLLPILPTLNDTCDTVGIIAPAVMMTSAMQCAEALKILTENMDIVRNKVHHFDCWTNGNMDIGISRIKNPHCATCSETPTHPSLELQHEQLYTVLCGRDTVQVLPSKERKISLQDAEKVAIRRGYFIKRTPYFIEIDKNPYRLIVFQDGRLLIHGLKNINEGRKIYTELFG
ncbi:ThiF family adenylyltransferase [Lysinibacillus sp. BW-2-10]|uniref:ThiF family adenylyltransferase n=1 Tax=Lysinibacillus sp. BW-2-10 TaxID=2590030 RepID=UPI00117DE5F6|nr:ThiF family adenylyltransferase [Lysinibacillus sp. BW-2-10]TSI05192.1 thiazole biosynthesis adenylyltransferase ThiF [Lysinibacillus sp. BW-2-10]